MIATEFEYRRAATIDEAVAMLREADGSGRLLAGGHSLVPLMKFRLSQPEVLIDIARIPGLAGVREGNPIAVGATTTHATLAASDVLRRQAPAVSDAAGQVGDPQVRNRGTIGGSLAHADPAADLPAPMLALDAQIDVVGPGGRRTIAVGDFFQDLFTTALADDELIEAIRFAPAPVSAYAKLHQRASHFALVGVAAALEVDGGVCRAARVAITGLTSSARRMPAVEAALAGNTHDAATDAPAG
ncbi:MAG: FAD binding domain-containing protein, partial [Dehalococcoidia bacterium]